MRAYLWVTGVVFAAMTALHAWRMVAERSAMGAHGLMLTVLSAALAVWAFGLLRQAATTGVRS
jgi:hypothetical protein